MVAETADSARADADYRPFQDFAAWKNCFVDVDRWERYRRDLATMSVGDPKVLERARRIVRRVAAVETGAIEGLYEVDRGFTFSVALEAATWEAAVKSKGDKSANLIVSQLQAYDFILDFATGAVPITEAWIRELHAEVCKGQIKYTVHTPAGVQEHALPLGEYKRYPNHVVTPSGAVHSYAPVELTPTEMSRLVREITSDQFLTAHPSVQAAYAHHTLTYIHPFADGNGRVARALASVFTYRADSIPVMILSDQKTEYFSALNAADTGEPQTFVEFIHERALDGLQLAFESIRTAESPELDSSTKRLRSLFVTRGGYTHREVDQRAVHLIKLAVQAFKQIAKRSNVEGQYTLEVASHGAVTYPEFSSEHRLPVNGGGRIIRVIFKSFAPGPAEIVRTLRVYVPLDCGQHDDIVLQAVEADELFRARASDVMPESPALKMRLAMWVERLAANGLTDLSVETEKELVKAGYRKLNT